MTRDDFYRDLNGPKYDAWRPAALRAKARAHSAWESMVAGSNLRDFLADRNAPPSIARAAGFAETATLCDRCGKPTMHMGRLCYGCSQKQWDELHGRVGV